MRLPACLYKRVAHYLIPTITHEEFEFVCNIWWELSEYHYPNFCMVCEEFVPNVYSDRRVNDSYEIMVRESITDDDPFDAPVIG